jgi:hypothetical protein
LLLAAVLFFAYAAWRRVSLSTEALTAMLMALAVVGPDTLDERKLTSLQSTPLLAAALLQLARGIDWRNSWRCLVGAGLLIAAVLTQPEEVDTIFPVGVIVFHLAVFAFLLIGAMFRDGLARLLRLLASVSLVLASFAVMMGRVDAAAGIPPTVLFIYPLVIIMFLVSYGHLFGQRTSVVAAALILAGWLSLAGWRGYGWLRQMVLGLDHLLLSLALFAAAVLVSLAKSGFRVRWLTERLRLSMTRQR